MRNVTHCNKPTPVFVLLVYSCAIAESTHSLVYCLHVGSTETVSCQMQLNFPSTKQPLYSLLLPACQSKGVDTVACVAVNDAFVMDAWGKSVGAGDKVMMLADGNGQFTKSMGLELDLTDKGLGIRSRRYALLVDDQVSQHCGQLMLSYVDMTYLHVVDMAS